ncbi:T9SS type A sorting domain-containing protein [Confluentibacter lentus]|uniref:T9SS type A sorting domain-containing protein n=1 Tax=Confluentibacter lentus TaxID=1699412 RepID=UPI000C285B2A|nr:T9SS type A sorting domain-containing protein [Confluentibacter lentus]
MKKLLLILLMLPFLMYSQTKLGQDIDGEAVDDQSGWSISMSSDSNIVAIGAPRNDGNGSNSGHARIYEWNGTSWSQKGQDINGEAVDDFFGFSISISSNGNVVAIGGAFNNGNGVDSGHVRVYQWNGTSWVQLGQDIDGEAANDYSGYNLSLSSDGTIVAIAAPNNDGNGSNSGHTRVYQWNGTTWIKLGQDIDGEAANDQTGWGISLSSDGSIVAIGAYGNNGNGSASGHTRIYEWNGTSWVQLGQDIDGEAADDLSGIRLSLSSNGDIVAIGATGNDGNGAGAGHVRVYQWNGTSWVQLGQDIDGKAADNSSGFGVSISGDGTIVAIGATRNSDNGSLAGHARVFKWNGTLWNQIGVDINGEAAVDQFGYSVSLSSNGSKLAIGSRFNDGNGLDSGHVRVYDLSAVLSTESFNKDYFSMYPNPVKEELNINLNQGLELKQINIYNSLSQYLYSTKELKINTDNLKSGMYFIEIVTDKGKSAKKVIIE